MQSSNDPKIVFGRVERNESGDGRVAIANFDGLSTAHRSQVLAQTGLEFGDVGAPHGLIVTRCGHHVNAGREVGPTYADGASSEEPSMRPRPKGFRCTAADEARSARINPRRGPRASSSNSSWNPRRWYRRRPSRPQIMEGRLSSYPEEPPRSLVPVVRTKGDNRRG